MALNPFLGLLSRFLHLWAAASPTNFALQNLLRLSSFIISRPHEGQTLFCPFLPFTLTVNSDNLEFWTLGKIGQFLKRFSHSDFISSLICSCHLLPYLVTSSLNFCRLYLNCLVFLFLQCSNTLAAGLLSIVHNPLVLFPGCSNLLSCHTVEYLSHADISKLNKSLTRSKSVKSDICFIPLSFRVCIFKNLS